VATTIPLLPRCSGSPWSPESTHPATRHNPIPGEKCTLASRFPGVTYPAYRPVATQASGKLVPMTLTYRLLDIHTDVSGKISPIFREPLQTHKDQPDKHRRKSTWATDVIPVHPPNWKVSNLAGIHRRVLDENTVGDVSLLGRARRGEPDRRRTKIPSGFRPSKVGWVPPRQAYAVNEQLCTHIDILTYRLSSLPIYRWIDNTENTIQIIFTCEFNGDLPVMRPDVHQHASVVHV